eukprot:284815710_4
MRRRSKFRVVGRASPAGRASASRGLTLAPCASAALILAIVLIDLLAEQGAQRTADQRAADAVAAAVDHVAQDTARRGADDQAGRAVRTLAIIAAVGPAIDLVVRGQDALLVTGIVAIVARRVIVRPIARIVIGVVVVRVRIARVVVARPALVATLRLLVKRALLVEQALFVVEAALRGVEATLFGIGLRAGRHGDRGHRDRGCRQGKRQGTQHGYSPHICPYKRLSIDTGPFRVYAYQLNLRRWIDMPPPWSCRCACCRP